MDQLMHMMKIFETMEGQDISQYSLISNIFIPSFFNFNDLLVIKIT